MDREQKHATLKPDPIIEDLKILSKHFAPLWNHPMVVKLLKTEADARERRIRLAQERKKARQRNDGDEVPEAEVKVQDIEKVKREDVEGVQVEMKMEVIEEVKNELGQGSYRTAPVEHTDIAISVSNQDVVEDSEEEEQAMPATKKVKITIDTLA
ncbi:hypothetical protein HDV05_004262 [Chytridiales sp. JEL 0842]|nr:hypothetical protein HDV05_004262 [Chytridiales sp. JEL 0842]